MKKKDKAFGFFVNFDKEEIYFSRTFVNGVVLCQDLAQNKMRSSTS